MGEQMAMLIYALIFALGFLCCHTTFGVHHDLALPVINAKFEYAANGQVVDAQSVADLVSFKTKARHVQQNIEKDEEVLAEFSDLTSTQLNRYMNLPTSEK